MRPAGDDGDRSIGERYDEAAGLVISALGRLDGPALRSEVGEVREEFCPGDHSIRVGGYESGMKLVGIAQRLTRRATSVGGIVLISGNIERYGRITLRCHVGYRKMLSRPSIKAFPPGSRVASWEHD